MVSTFLITITIFRRFTFWAAIRGWPWERRGRRIWVRLRSRIWVKYIWRNANLEETFLISFTIRFSTFFIVYASNAPSTLTNFIRITFIISHTFIIMRRYASSFFTFCIYRAKHSSTDICTNSILACVLPWTIVISLAFI